MKKRKTLVYLKSTSLQTYHVISDWRQVRVVAYGRSFTRY
jgi:hypothetical protein